MRSILTFVVVAALAIWAAWLIHSLPGNLAVDLGDIHLAASTPVAITLLGLLFLALYIVVRVIAVVIASPRIIRRRSRERSRVRGIWR